MVSAAVSFLTIWLNGRRADRDRQRKLFGEAFGACMDYKEFVFIVRRRDANNPGAERTRITGELSAVQRNLNRLRAVLRVENRTVGDRYAELVRATREIAGPQISRGWDLPPAQDDEDVHIRDVDLKALDAPEERFLQAVRDYLGWGPPWLRSTARGFRGRSTRNS